MGSSHFRLFASGNERKAATKDAWVGLDIGYIGKWVWLIFAAVVVLHAAGSKMQKEHGVKISLMSRLAVNWR